MSKVAAMSRRLVSKVINRLTLGKVKYGWWTVGCPSDESPIFIGGCPRTGTTLLYSVLTSHSRIYIALESALLAGNRDVDHLVRRLAVPAGTIERVLGRSYCAADFTQQLLTTIMKSKGKQRWGDKSPLNVTSIDQFFNWFPRGRFVHLVRDGRDVVCSLRTHNGAFGTQPVDEVVNPWPKCVERWVAWTRKGMKWRDDPRYFEMRYESLVDDPETSTRRLLTWLGEPWEPDLLNRAQQQQVATHPSINKPINKQALARWRRDLDAEGRSAFEGPGQQLLLELGYAEDDQWLREAESAGLQALNTCS